MTSSHTPRLPVQAPEGIKSPVAVATIEEIDLEGLQVINGYQLNVNDRVLVKNQTDLSTNGIYSVQQRAWVRAKDWKVSQQVANGVIILDNNTGQLWRGVFAGVLDIGVTDVSFTDVTSSGRTVNYVQETLPVEPVQDGAKWYKPSEATTYIYFVDEDSGQWVEDSVQSAEGTLRSELDASDSSVLVGGVEAGKAARTLKIEETNNGTGDSFVFNSDKGNAIASDLNSCMIGAGGYAPDENLIGYIKPSETFVGDSSTKVFTTTFDASSSGDIRVELVRADGVRLGVTFKDSTQVDIVGGKAQVTYPIDGRFVNNGSGGSEGTDQFISANETLIISSTVGIEQTGTNSNLCSVFGGYDNVIEQGIMQQVSGAHHRVEGGDHNTVIGGSYNVVRQGSYGAIFGGTNNRILDVGNSSGSGVLGGVGNTVDSAVGWSIGGVSNLSSGSFSTCVGGLNNTASGNGAFACGRDNIASGQDSFSGGKENISSGVYSFSSGLRNTASGPYSVAFGRDCTTTGEYAVGCSYGAQIDGNNSSGFGKDVRTRFFAEQAIGVAKSASIGDRQTSVVVLTNTTTSATATRLRPSDFARLTLDSGECWAFSGLIIGKRTDVAGESNGFRVSGVIDNSTGSAVIVGTPVVENIGDAASTWSASVVVGTSNSLEIRVGGDAGKTVDWVCRLEMSMII